MCNHIEIQFFFFFFFFKKLSLGGKGTKGGVVQGFDYI